MGVGPGLLLAFAWICLQLLTFACTCLLWLAFVCSSSAAEQGEHCCCGGRRPTGPQLFGGRARRALLLRRSSSHIGPLGASTTERTSSVNAAPSASCTHTESIPSNRERHTRAAVRRSSSHGDCVECLLRGAPLGGTGGLGARFQTIL